MLGVVAEPEFMYGAETFEAYQMIQEDKVIDKKKTIDMFEVYITGV